MGVFERDAAARHRFLEAIRGGANVTDAAKAAGVRRQSVYNWRKRGDPEVAAALAAADQRGGQGRAKRPAVATPEQADMRAEALATLRAIHLNGNAEDKDRIAAARGLLQAMPVAGAPAGQSPGPGGVDPRGAADDQERVLRVLEGARAVLREVREVRS